MAYRAATRCAIDIEEVWRIRSRAPHTPRVLRKRYATASSYASERHCAYVTCYNRTFSSDTFYYISYTEAEVATALKKTAREEARHRCWWMRHQEGQRVTCECRVRLMRGDHSRCCAMRSGCGWQRRADSGAPCYRIQRGCEHGNDTTL